MQSAGSSLLHELNPNLHASREVEIVVGYLAVNGEAIPNDPTAKISAYLGFLADQNYVNDGLLTNDEQSIDRQISNHIIKATDVPEGYFELRRRIGRQRGYGDIEITRAAQKQMVEVAQVDQRAGLEKWLGHLGDEDRAYPDWFKFYTFGSITKLVNDHTKKGEFMKRSQGTTAPYPELNPEALGYVYEALNKSRIKHRAIDGAAHGEQLQTLLSSANFSKLYALAVREVTPLLAEVKGSWTTFKQSSDRGAAQTLASSLQGHGTDWCTANEGTASNQLLGGDFYVFFSQNQDGKPIDPRLAIRMAEGVVAEVRGINTNQEVEPEMAAVVAERLQDLPGGEAYVRRAQHMNRLTAIDQQLASDPLVELTDKELRFLYEMDHDILGFGNDLVLDEYRDPRIDEIRAKRQGRDRLAIARLLPETIRDQLQDAGSAYRAVARQLQAEPLNGESELLSAELERLFILKDKVWRENGVYDKAAIELISHGTRYNLVVTPNVEATERQIVALAEAFGKQQPLATYVDTRLFCKGRYTNQGLSGNAGAAIARLSLIPSRSDDRLGNQTIAVQVRRLRQQQALKPTFRLRVPTLLDAITYWHVLKERGYNLNDSQAYDMTHIRHFNLAEADNGLSSVPSTYVGDGGKPRLGSSAPQMVEGTRLAMG